MVAVNSFVENAMHTLISKFRLALSRGQEGRSRRAAEEPAVMTEDLAAILCVMLGLDGRPTPPAVRAHARGETSAPRAR